MKNVEWRKEEIIAPKTPGLKYHIATKIL